MTSYMYISKTGSPQVVQADGLLERRLAPQWLCDRGGFAAWPQTGTSKSDTGLGWMGSKEEAHQPLSDSKAKASLVVA